MDRGDEGWKKNSKTTFLHIFNFLFSPSNGSEQKSCKKYQIYGVYNFMPSPKNLPLPTPVRTQQAQNYFSQAVKAKNRLEFLDKFFSRDFMLRRFPLHFFAATSTTPFEALIHSSMQHFSEIMRDAGLVFYFSRMYL